MPRSPAHPWRWTCASSTSDCSVRTAKTCVHERAIAISGRVSDEIVHAVYLFPTLATLGGAEVPKDRPIDGVDQSDFFT